MNFRFLLLSLSLITIPNIGIFADEDSSVFDEVVVTARQREETAQSVQFP